MNSLGGIVTAIVIITPVLIRSPAMLVNIIPIVLRKAIGMIGVTFDVCVSVIVFVSFALHSVI